MNGLIGHRISPLLVTCLQHIPQWSIHMGLK
jgi:hypothetical protein